ncbi:MAG: type II toxin-antitoxin system PemK/MazF family toxin [bacterium]|nr:type II toxin-antitoxin system PemK/MazF family toxin [bacterium]
MPLNVQLARGDIWVVDFGSNPKDPEQSLIRPAVIVSDDRLHHPNLKMVIVVPGTTTVRGVSLHVVVAPDADNGLDQPTVFQVEQLRAVSIGRLQQRLGYLDAVSRYAVDEIMRNVLSL